VKECAFARRDSEAGRNEVYEKGAEIDLFHTPFEMGEISGPKPSDPNQDSGGGPEPEIGLIHRSGAASKRDDPWCWLSDLDPQSL
jgi:hypothetical protein